jgi:transcriptional regulator of acetoin/glycerol metabolism
MKYTEMAQREIYNVISNYVWRLENGTIQIDEFDDETLTESQQDKLIKAMQKELDKMVDRLEKKGVVVF